MGSGSVPDYIYNYRPSKPKMVTLGLGFGLESIISITLNSVFCVKECKLKVFDCVPLYGDFAIYHVFDLAAATFIIQSTC